jgi:hypothetical protein
MRLKMVISWSLMQLAQRLDDLHRDDWSASKVSVHINNIQVYTKSLVSI